MKHALLTALALLGAASVSARECTCPCPSPVSSDPAPQAPATCKSYPPEVRIVQTGMHGAGQFRTVTSGHPATVFAFRFQTPTGTTGAAASAAIRPGSAAGKLVTISRCPGGAPVNRYCRAASSQVSSVRYYVGIDRTDRCVLQPGDAYYVNVQSRYTESGPYNCTTIYDCQFVYEQH